MQPYSSLGVFNSIGKMVGKSKPLKEQAMYVFLLSSFMVLGCVNFTSSIYSQPPVLVEKMQKATIFKTLDSDNEYDKVMAACK